MAERLSHLDDQGRARMVDVGAKDDTERVAVARARVTMQPHTLALIQAGSAQKGDVLTVAQIAGIQAAKRAHELIPMCHPLLLTHVAVTVAPGPGSGAHENNSEAGDMESWVEIEATVRTTGKTGVEMEALTAASVAALTVYDMCKAADRGMRITDVRLVHKSGGKSGNWHTAE